MTFRAFPSSAVLSAAVFCLLAGIAPAAALAQSSSSPSNSDTGGQTSSSSPDFVRERAPSLVDPAGPTISLVSAEPVFVMAAALNACGYDDGLEESAPVRKRVRDEMNLALAKSEDARNKRDKICLYIAQHRMTGGERDIAQYISLALYLTPPPEMETAAELTEMPPDSTQVVEIVPLLRDFVAAVDLHGIWLAVHHIYDAEADQLHDPLSKMIVSTNLYLKMPAETYNGRRFVVVIEPMLSPRMVNARIYGTDYVVVVSPVNGTIRMSDVRHTYLHYVIEPLLYVAGQRHGPDAADPQGGARGSAGVPLPLRHRGPDHRVPHQGHRGAHHGHRHSRVQDPGGTWTGRRCRAMSMSASWYQQKVEAVRLAAMRHDMTQGFVLTQYFYEQMIQFEKDPASLKDTIGEMVYSMDVDQQVHRARRSRLRQGRRRRRALAQYAAQIDRP